MNLETRRLLLRPFADGDAGDRDPRVGLPAGWSPDTAQI